jgi:hypothetical protein
MNVEAVLNHEKNKVDFDPVHGRATLCLAVLRRTSTPVLAEVLGRAWEVKHARA